MRHALLACTDKLQNNPVDNTIIFSNALLMINQSQSKGKKCHVYRSHQASPENAENADITVVSDVTMPSKMLILSVIAIEMLFVTMKKSD